LNEAFQGAPPEGKPTAAARLALSHRAGGVVTPLITTILAFLIAGLVVLGTGRNPVEVYKGIFNGTGLNWFFQFGHHHIDIPFTDTRVFFWWDTDAFANEAAYNLGQTLLLTTTLMLTGLAVAFAFRCGLFNIGGQGQYGMGAIVAAWVGSSFAGLNGLAHILLVVVLAMLVGAAWAGISGILKATVGAHEVITTIMLNWIAYWIGSYAFSQGGPLQNTDPERVSVPISNDVAEGAKLPVWWGDVELQGLHIGFFIALVALVAFWVIMNRTTLGYEVRAVGFNPEAARYGGISVSRNYFLAMAISGVFAGLAGALDILGWQFRLGVLDVQTSQIGFIGIAVALLGRNTAIGVFFGALLFGGLLYGTSTRSIDPELIQPELAGNLTLIIQALVLLFIGADILVIYLWRKLVGRRAEAT